MSIPKHRTLRDFQVSSHLLFLWGIYHALLNQIYELALLESMVVVLSILFHINHERESPIAMADRVCARLLFLYGMVQMFYAPSDLLLAVEALLAGATAGIWRFCIMFPEYNERLHPLGLHICPGLWSVVVAAKHEALVF